MTYGPNQGVAESSRRIRRRKDHRDGLGTLIDAVASARAKGFAGSMLRHAFEESLRSLVPVRSLQLCDAASRRARSAAEDEVLVFEVGESGDNPASLEVRTEPGRLDEWGAQLLRHAARLAALVLKIEQGQTVPERAATPAERLRRGAGEPLVGSAPALEALRAEIARVAATDFTVLLEGESGVGKELVARRIHAQSRRSDGPFVAINCAALVETLLEAELFGIEERTATGVRGRRGKFEAADGGTLFLDEVSDLSMSAQAKLLRAIQDLAVERVGSTGTHRVDIRIVAATNRGLRDLVDRGLFRADLYYRLSGVDLRVPSLRERRSDILELASHFLSRHRSTRALSLSDSAANALLTYDWPGNVRELERVVERAVALSDSDAIAVDDLPPTVRREYAAVLGPSVERGESLRVWARRYARLVLDRSGGNKRQAARTLGISPHTLAAYLRDAPVDNASSAGEDWEGTDTDSVAVG
jgi:DNA-binding NtrC family response regulator